MLRLSYMFTKVKGISEFDLNPIILYDKGKGGMGVDARFRLDLERDVA